MNPRSILSNFWGSLQFDTPSFYGLFRLKVGEFFHHIDTGDVWSGFTSAALMSLFLAGRERNIIFVSKGYHLPAIRIVFTTHGDYPFPLMEIISVTRGDHPSDPWRLSPSIKGMIPLRPACLIRHRYLFAMAKVQHFTSGSCAILCDSVHF